MRKKNHVAAEVLLRQALEDLRAASESKDKDDMLQVALSVQWATFALYGVETLTKSADFGPRWDAVRDIRLMLQPLISLGLDSTVWPTNNRKVRNVFWTLDKNLRPRAIAEILRILRFKEEMRRFVMEGSVK